MKTIRSQTFYRPAFLYNWSLCIILVWITVLYSVIIQYTIIEIPKGMLVFGSFVLILFLFSLSHKAFNLDYIFTKESSWMLGFMVYMLFSGIITSPSIDNHLSQWITSLEYMFMMIVISAIIMNSGTESFHYMLLIQHPLLHLLKQQHLMHLY